MIPAYGQVPVQAAISGVAFSSVNRRGLAPPSTSLRRSPATDKLAANSNAAIHQPAKVFPLTPLGAPRVGLGPAEQQIVDFLLGVIIREIWLPRRRMPVMRRASKVGYLTPLQFLHQSQSHSP